MGRTKLKKFIEIKSFANVFDKESESVSEQIEKYFNNGNSLTLELGCGHGDYTISLAQKFPERNFIGVDVKAPRVYVGAKYVLEQNITNAAFIAMRIENLKAVFANKIIDEIYIPFPDPHVRRKSAPRRLISKEFLEIYKSVLSPEGRIHFKSDNPELFEFGIKNLEAEKVEIIKINRDVHNSEYLSPAEEITTKYERHYVQQGRIINYVCFAFQKKTEKK